MRLCSLSWPFFETGSERDTRGKLKTRHLSLAKLPFANRAVQGRNDRYVRYPTACKFETLAPTNSGAPIAARETTQESRTGRAPGNA
jgi:hypothetical protein